MATERGQRTTIRFGGVRADVSLVKASTKPKAAEHETKRVLAPAVGVAVTDSRPAELTDPFTGETYTADVVDVAVSGAASVSAERVDMTIGKAPLVAEAPDPLTDDPAPAAPQDVPPAETTTVPPVTDAPTPPLAAPVAPPTTDEPQEYVPPTTTVQQGVHLEDGTWVDLTERLQEVDERTKLDGMEVVATIGQSAVLRERVTAAHYVCGVKADEFKVLALMWHGLRQADRAAAVVWTKKTAQALGFIVARGTLGEDAHLVLLELEWAENMRPPNAKALGPINARVTPEEVTAAIDLVDAFAKPPSALNELRDERLAKRAELLALARAGELEAYEAPVEPLPDATARDLAAAFAQSAEALR